MRGICNRCRRQQKRQNAHATQGMETKHRKILTLAPWPACSTASIGAAKTAPIVRASLGQEMNGGARAWAWKRARELNRSGAMSSQATRAAWRQGVATVACGALTGPPV